MKRLRYMLVIAAGVLAVALFAGLALPVSVAQDKPSRVTIAYCEDCIPFQFTDEGGEPAGILIDHWNLWSEKTGIAIEYREASWGETLTLVGDGKVDLHAGLFFSDARDRFLDYGAVLTRTNTQAFCNRDLYMIDRIAMPKRIE